MIKQIENFERRKNMNKNFFVTRNDGKKIAVRMTEASKEDACPTIIFAHGFGGNSREILSHGEGFDKGD